MCRAPYLLMVAESAHGGASGPFGAWRLLEIAGYDPDGPGNIYFASIETHPLDPNMRLGRGAREAALGGCAAPRRSGVCVSRRAGQVAQKLRGAANAPRLVR